MYEKVVIERINKIISVIEMERYNSKQDNSGVPFDEGFDCGTQLALDLLNEWKEELI